MARVDTLGHFLTDVADAIREKKGTEEEITASDFDTEIENLPSGGGYDWSAIGYSSEPTWISEGYNYAKEIYDNWDSSITKTNAMFSNDRDLLIFPKVDTSNVTNMASMFSECSRVQEIELDLSSATNVNSYLYRCTALRKLKLKGNTSLANFGFSNSQLTSLETVDLSELTASNLNTFYNLFAGCYSLKNIYMSNLNTSKVTTTSSMFYNCKSLTSLDLSFFDTTALKNISSMFTYCTSLLHLDIRTFDFNKFTNTSTAFGNASYDGPPDNCEIIVADQTQKDWLAANFSRLTNVKTVAEYEAE